MLPNAKIHKIGFENNERIIVERELNKNQPRLAHHFLTHCRRGFWIRWTQLGDVMGLCAAAHLLSCKIGEPVRVHFSEDRKNIIKYFDGVIWVPKKEIPNAIDCSDPPLIKDWPKSNGVKRFYRFMDATMSPGKSFDIHMNCTHNGGERLIGLITHAGKQGDISEDVLNQMINEAKEKYPGYNIVLFGNKDNTLVPEGVEDLRQDNKDIDWLVDFMKKLDLLITPQSGPCFIAAGLKIPMWVYRSKEFYWDYVLNYDTYKVEKWFERSKKLINIVIPCSRPNNIPAILKSINNQEFGIFEVKIIIMFDFENKEDISQEVISEMEVNNCEYHIWRIPRDDKKVHGKSVNKAIKEYVSGGLVYILDDDNLLYPNFLTRMSKIIEDNPSKNVIYFQQKNRLAIPENYSPRSGNVDVAMFIFNKTIVNGLDLPYGRGYDGFLAELLYKTCLDSCLFIREDLCYYNKLKPIELKAYLINRADRPDRLEYAINECRKVGIKPIRFDAIIKQDNGTFECAGAYGCAMSHLEIIKMAQQQRLPYVMILEDDVRFSSNFRETLNVVLREIEELQWDIIHFYNQDGKIISSVSDNLNKTTGTTLLHAYLVSNAAFTKILNNPPTIAVDWHFKQLNMIKLITKRNIVCQHRALKSDIPTSNNKIDVKIEHEFKRVIKDTTLICVACVAVDKAIISMEYSLSHCSFSQVKLLTSSEIDCGYKIKIPHIGSLKEYSRFMIKELWKYIDTKYCLVVQYDGWIMNPNTWRDEWYDFDYIGGDNGRGGNGGFSWRSKRLHDLVKDMIPDEQCNPEDWSIADWNRKALEDKGIKFGTKEVMNQFCVDGQQYVNQFGHHRGILKVI